MDAAAVRWSQAAARRIAVAIPAVMAQSIFNKAVLLSSLGEAC
jgi:hypothetical protein